MIFSIFRCFISYAKGLFVSGSVYMLSQHMDKTISKPSLEHLKENNRELYEEGQTTVVTNLIVVSPVLYLFVDQIILDHNASFSWVKYFSLIVFQKAVVYHQLSENIPKCNLDRKLQDLED